MRKEWEQWNPSNTCQNKKSIPWESLKKKCKYLWRKNVNICEEESLSTYSHQHLVTNELSGKKGTNQLQLTLCFWKPCKNRLWTLKFSFCHLTFEVSCLSLSDLIATLYLFQTIWILPGPTVIDKYIKIPTYFACCPRKAIKTRPSNPEMQVPHYL